MKESLSVNISQLLSISNTSNNKINVWKNLFGLHQLAGVTLMEEIVDSIGVDSYLARSW